MASGTAMASSVENVLNWDLLSSPLAIGLSAASITNSEHHIIESGGFRLSATLIGVVNPDSAESDLGFNVALTCGDEPAVTLTFTYPNSRSDLGSVADWFVAYSIVENKLVVKTSNDEATLADEESLLSSTSPDLPQPCIDALNAEQAKGGSEGALVKFKINQDNHAAAKSSLSLGEF